MPSAVGDTDGTAEDDQLIGVRVDPFRIGEDLATSMGATRDKAALVHRVISARICSMCFNAEAAVAIGSGPPPIVVIEPISAVCTRKALQARWAVAKAIVDCDGLDGDCRDGVFSLKRHAPDQNRAAGSAKAFISMAFPLGSLKEHHGTLARLCLEADTGLNSELRPGIGQPGRQLFPVDPK
ncbi:MAG: hypothetical protein RID23_17995 [Roseovarius sp.]